MCVVSMVSDHFMDRIPYALPQPTIQPGVVEMDWTKALRPSVDLEELRKLIAEFKEAMAAAKTVDRLTGQPDCVDPEKAKLEARVEELEKRIAHLESLGQLHARRIADLESWRKS